VAEKLGALRRAARKRDLDEAEAIVDELDGTVIEGADAEETAQWGEGWVKVKEAIDNFSFSDVVSAADALLAALDRLH
jgi:hypothetical protein